MRNLVPHDKRVRLKGKPHIVGSMTQVSYEATDSSFGRKAWITHFKREKGWSVAGCLVENVSADTPLGQQSDKPMKKADAIEAAAAYIIHGYF